MTAVYPLPPPSGHEQDLVQPQGQDQEERELAGTGSFSRRLGPRQRNLDEQPGAQTLVDIFLASASRWRRRPALEDANGRLSYGQLERQAKNLARHLHKMGVGPGDRVGVRVPGGTRDLYVAVLGVLMAGAAYVPVDYSDPDARAELLWQEAGVSVTVGKGLSVEKRGPQAASPRAGREQARPGRGFSPDDECWVIFTSGSTGKPKGVAVRHRSALAFVEAETRLWTVSAQDRVLAGLSISFDASCEEIWLAWRNGATLVAAPRDIVRSGADLGPWLEQRAITVVSTVPSLASLWEEKHLSSVRLLILGGEVCPPSLGWRLAAGREVWNTYGPTEATVVSTAAPVVPLRPITIGRPLEGWRVALVDDEGTPVRVGEPGELVIGGAGLGRYLDPALDEQRYAPLPALGWLRAYRTGDMARSSVNGLEFLGRRDDQVKINGRRVELGEIDAHLASVPGVKAAAAALRLTPAGNAVLVGYVVGEVDVATVRAELAATLPANLVPRVVALASLPLKVSGKVDRAALPWPEPEESLEELGALSTISEAVPVGAEEIVDSAGSSQATEAAAGGIESWLAEQWREQLGPVTLCSTSDFFELGGTSLAAARLVSALRRRFPTVAVADVYVYRRLGNMAAHLEKVGISSRPRTASLSRVRRWGAVQLAGSAVALGIGSVPWVVGVLAYNQWFGSGVGLRVGWLAVVAGWLLLSSAPGRALLVAATRALILRDLRPGRYPRHSWLATRVWFVDRLADVLNIDQLAGTPWAAQYGRLFGARVGRHVGLGTVPPPTGLVFIGDNATVESDVDLRGWWVEEGELVVGKVSIEAGARVGTRCSLMPGAHVGEGSEIEPGSVVSGFVPPGERWSGSPARRVGEAGDGWPSAPPPPSTKARRALVKARSVAGFAVSSTLPLVAAVPELAILWALNGPSFLRVSSFGLLAAETPLLTLCYLATYALLAAAVVRGAFRHIKPGWHRDDSAAAWALWFTGTIMGQTRALLFPLYANLLTRAWLRLAGIRVGWRTEVSLAVGLNPLTRIGETSFLADDVLFAGARARQGWVEVTPIEVGSRTFLGNGAILRPGTKLGDDCLVGVLSSPPGSSPDGTSWLGLPALELPRVPERPDPARTVSPSRRLFASRAAMEVCRVLVPGTVSALLGLSVFVALESVGRTGGVLDMLLAAPVLV
ncbi:MAG TPA: amino acid adenylation domain-containing protein, partial [Acidimicrobiales bacterium]|nr:amino acid adenylation domain-containing protein [Acidimicrobiales bacterium]